MCVRFLLSGVWHSRNAARQHMNQLFFDAFEAGMVKRFRPYLGQMLWYAYATKPNEFNAERRSLLKGFFVGWVEVAARELGARGKTAITAADVHAYMLERAAECPLALLALQWTWHAAVYQMSLDAIRRTEEQPLGDFELYKTFCRFTTGFVFPVTNAYKYMYIMIYQLLQWEIVSPREYLTLVKALFTGRTPNCENCELDIVVENIIGYVTKLLGKHTTQAGSARTRETIGRAKELAESRLATQSRVADADYKPKPPRSGAANEQFQAGRHFVHRSQIAQVGFVHRSQIAQVGAVLMLAKGGGKATKSVDFKSFVSTLDQELSPLLLAADQLGLARLRSRAPHEIPSSSYAKPDRPGETSAYPSLDVYAADIRKRREFKNLRDTTSDERTIREYRLDGTKGQHLFTKALLVKDIRAAREAFPEDESIMADVKLNAAARPALCAELARVRMRHPQLTQKAAARFANGEGFDTPLAKLRIEPSGPVVSFKGVEYKLLDTELVWCSCARSAPSAQRRLTSPVSCSRRRAAARGRLVRPPQQQTAKPTRSPVSMRLAAVLTIIQCGSVEHAQQGGVAIAAHGRQSDPPGAARRRVHDHVHG
jgi:hypothetical protein